ncbi:MAG: tRNA pseudouridine(38-40) synthase TruA [Ferruginibacter sp.]
MARYFLEVAYKGTAYAGFQIQQNANTIQAEVEKALHTYFRTSLALTGSSRTDAGVHAFQNFFHVDTALDIHSKSIYHLNAILPEDIVIRNIFLVKDDAHCRFDATSRTYLYSLYQSKNPFVLSTAYFFPYPLDITLMQQAAQFLLNTQNFESFAKKNTQVYTHICKLMQSSWFQSGDCIKYKVTGNRFLRGMVRGLVGTMLQVGTQKISLQQFKQIAESKNPAQTDFSTPAKGLTLLEVKYSFL